jgi:hypothetical protein
VNEVASREEEVKKPCLFGETNKNEEQRLGCIEVKGEEEAR